MPYNYVRKTDRWTPNRKIDLVEEVTFGGRNIDELANEHGIHADELRAWVRRFERFGASGVKQTRLQGLRAKENA